MTIFNDGESLSSVRTKINAVLQHADGTASELVINEVGADVDFRVESDTNANALFVEGATGNVGIGTSSPAYKLDVAGATYGRLTTTTFQNGGFINARTAASNGTFNTYDFVEGTTTTAFLRNFGSAFGAGADNQLSLFNTQSGPLTFGTNNTERLRIDSGGNVGLGTAAPEGKFDVYDANAAILKARVGAGGSGVASLRMKYDAFEHGFYVAGTNALVAYDYGAGSERLRIDSSGNVGIGTSSPANYSGFRTLQITGGSPVSGGLLRLNTSDNSRAGIIYTDANGLRVTTETAHPILFETNNAERLRIDASGNLGLGVTPSAWTAGFKAFEMSGAGAGLYSTSSADMNLISNSYNTGGAWKYGANAAAAVFQATSGTFKFLLAPSGTAGNAITFTQAMTLDAGGNLLVGTTALGVAANDLVGINLYGGGQVNVSGNAVPAADFNRKTDNGAIIQFRRGGSPVGDIQVTATTTTYNTSSDYRLKEDLQPIADASSRLAALNPVNFAWKADGTRTDGFIAHEVQAVIPQAVTGKKDATDEDGNPVYQGIDQSKIVPLLTAALQEALAKIAALEARVGALES